MPQTSTHMHDYWGGADDAPALAHLKERGFVLTPQWTWLVPENHVYNARDINAIVFLIEEWDFGGVINGPSIGQARVTLDNGVWQDRE